MKPVIPSGGQAVIYVIRNLLQGRLQFLETETNMRYGLLFVHLTVDNAVTSVTFTKRELYGVLLRRAEDAASYLTDLATKKLDEAGLLQPTPKTVEYDPGSELNPIRFQPLKVKKD